MVRRHPQHGLSDGNDRRPRVAGDAGWLLESSTGLPVIDVPISTVASDSTEQPFSPNEFQFAESPSSQGIIAAEPSYEISFGVRRLCKSAKEAVREWNVATGFIRPPSRQKRKRTKPEWQRNWKTGFAVNLARRRCGCRYARSRRRRRDRPAAACQAGAGGRAAGRAVRPIAGDSNFDVVEGERFDLNEANSKYPFAAVVQVDPKLDHAVGSHVSSSLGKFAAGMVGDVFRRRRRFLAFCVYHFFVLPQPAADVSASRAYDTETGMLGFLVPFVDFFRKPRILPSWRFCCCTDSRRRSS